MTPLACPGYAYACDNFNQSSLPKGNVAPECFCLIRQNTVDTTKSICNSCPGKDVRSSTVVKVREHKW